VPKPVLFDEKHPFYHQRSCYTYNENNVLIEGFKQAQVLINAVEVKQGLPVAIEDLKETTAASLPENMDDFVKRYSMHILQN
jgi:large subunit ribosomal protein L37